jgi:hypothetical protein
MEDRGNIRVPDAGGGTCLAQENEAGPIRHSDVIRL